MPRTTQSVKWRVRKAREALKELGLGYTLELYDGGGYQIRDSYGNLINDPILGAFKLEEVESFIEAEEIRLEKMRYG